MARTALPALCLALTGCALFSSEPIPTGTTGTTSVSTVPEDELDPDPSDGKQAPVSLTASDGTGLAIVSLQAHAVVEDPLALTELHIVFQNPEPRAVEGQFSITLPPSATLSRFAMKQDWGWQEGEVVELQAARRAYEDFLHRRQDPALLEKQPGNEFHARVFPIAASGRKELIITYAETLTKTGEPYRVHLRGLPILEQLDVKATIARHGMGAVPSQVVETHKQHERPVDFVVPLPAIMQQPQAGLRNGDLVLARVTPVATAKSEAIESLQIVFDTSASRALGFESAVQKLAALVGELARKKASMPLKVTCFDQTIETVYEGSASGFGPDATKKILARGAFGASDLGRALAAAGNDGKRYKRLLVVTDGIATMGVVGGALKARAASLSQSGIQRLDALVSGGIRDQAGLASLTTAGLPKDGVVLDGNLRAPAMARRLESATVPRLDVSVAGAKWVWPRRIEGLQPGDAVLVYAQMEKPGTPIVALDGASGEKMRYPLPLSDVARPLIERAAVAAEIASLEAARADLTDVEKKKALHAQIVTLSTKFRVLCDETALLVLETEADYARFGIDRRALADILTVGENGVELVSRQGAPVQPQIVQAVPMPTIEKAKKNRASDDLDSALDGVPADRDHDGTPDVADKESAGPSTPGGVPEPMQAAPPPRPEPVMAPAPAVAMRPSLQRADRHAQAADPLGGLSEGAGQGGSGSLYDRAQPEPPKVDPYTGTMKEVMDLVQKKKKLDAALERALAWHEGDVGDVLALVALGEVWEKKGAREAAGRAYGSIIDLFPGRADLRRFAGERLERVEGQLALAIDTYEKAREQRPDHPASHRLLAYALVRDGRYEDAFTVISEGAARSYPEGRFRGVDRILHEDLGLVASTWLRHQPNDKKKILGRLEQAHGALPTGPSLRFVLNWETDANDVDFHILDSKNGHAFYSQPHLPSGGDLYADVTTGYGPECFTIAGKPSAYPYKLQAHYYSRGPMGYGMGKLEIIEDDGQGDLKIEERPFVIMVDQAFVDLGRVTGPLR